MNKKLIIIRVGDKSFRFNAKDLKNRRKKKIINSSTNKHFVYSGTSISI